MFKSFYRWLIGLFTPDRPYKTVMLEELPDHLEDKKLYVLGEGEHLWSAAMLCPCGCKSVIHLSLHKEGRPRWKIDFHQDGTSTLSPSVWRQVGCRSHFFLRRGRIDWCRDK